MKLCFVLDPSRRSMSFKRVDGDSCWVQWTCPEDGDTFHRVLNTEALKGYVFKHPKVSNTVVIYDWVSRGFNQHVLSLTW